MELSDSEQEAACFICMVLTLSANQVAQLCDPNKVQNDVPYLSKAFLSTLDDLQQTLLIGSRLYQRRIDSYKLLEDINELKAYIKLHMRSLLLRSADESEMEQILIDCI